MITVLGAGAWGTALAQTIAKNSPVDLWTRNQAVIDAIEKDQCNHLYLPNILLDPNITVRSSIAECQNELILAVVPSQHLRATLIALKADIPQNTPIILCAKGIENKSLKLMHEVAEDVLDNPKLLILSGPNFADEVAKGLPSATTLASNDIALARKVSKHIGTPYFRPYISDDMIGTQMGGALKNVLAIACGMITEKGLGHNAQAALITRGIAEMNRLCLKMGGKSETLLGLSGVGDVMLTCHSQKSRNFSLGMEIAAGKSLSHILKERKTVQEGAYSAISVKALAEKHGIELPICFAVHDILHQGVDLHETIMQLLHRPFTQEM